VKRGLLVGQVAVLAAAAWWRLHDLGRWSLDGDELYSWYDVQLVMAGESWPEGARSYPLGYLLMIVGAALGGIAEGPLRAVPALCGLGVVAALLWMRRDVVPAGVALGAAALAATCPWLVFHAQTARFYAPLLLFATLATLWALPGEGRRPGGAAAAWLAAVLCHPAALLLGLALLVPLLVGPGRLRRLAVVGVLAALGAALLVTIDQGATVAVFRRALERVDPGRYDALHFLLGLGYNVGPMVGVLFLLGVGATPRARQPSLLVCAMLPPLALLTAALLDVVSAHQRYAMAALPGALLVAGWGWAWAWRRHKALGTVLSLAALAAPVPGLMAYAADGNRHDARRVAEWLADHARPDDLFVIEEHATVELYLYDEPGFADITTVEAPLDSKKMRTFVRHRRDCWVVLKASRMGRAADGAFMEWVESHFDEQTRIGRPPPPLVRHDNRYVIWRRRERLPPPGRTASRQPEAPSRDVGSDDGR